MSFTVYMHVNKQNNKKYIGITCQKYVSQRWHNGEGYKQQRRFYSAIKHYGFDGFEHIILHTGLTKEDAEQKEKELIALHRSNDLKYGYNIENGGHINKYTLEQRKAMSEAHKGHKASAETRRKQSESHIGLSTNWLIGRKASAETRQKMSEVHRGANNVRASAVCQFSMSGDFVARYDTIVDAIKALGRTKDTGICKCCLGVRKSAYGFRWAYAEAEGRCN